MYVCMLYLMYIYTLYMHTSEFVLLYIILSVSVCVYRCSATSPRKRAQDQTWSTFIYRFRV
jgi:hypothetical protein